MIATIKEVQKVVSKSQFAVWGSSTLGGSCRRETEFRTVAPGDLFSESHSSGGDVFGTSAIRISPGLPGHISLGSSLYPEINKLCRFSLKRPPVFRVNSSSPKIRKLRKLEIEEAPAQVYGITSSHIEGKISGSDSEAHALTETVQHRSAHRNLALTSADKENVDKELIHVSLSSGCGCCREHIEHGKDHSLMLHQDDPLQGDTCEVCRVSRPALLHNLHHVDTNHGHRKLEHYISEKFEEVRRVQSVEVLTRQTPVHDEGTGTTIPRGSVPSGLLESNRGCNREMSEDYLQESGSQELATSHEDIYNDELCERLWNFKVVASVQSHNRQLTSTDVIGTIAFERTNDYFATGGIARKIRVYAYESLVAGLGTSEEDEEDDEEGSVEYLKQRKLRKRRVSATCIDHARCCVQEVCTPAKLSSLQWHQERPNVIASGDYDGVVAEWDVERICAVTERDENGGQRIWSIDYSKDTPDLIASASDDGTVRMWDSSSDQSVAILHPPTYSAICCAEFGPVSSSLIALASADSNLYVYDTRWLSIPLFTLAHHKRAASYIRFLSRHRLVSSSIDSSVKLWDITSASTTAERVKQSTPPVETESRTEPTKTFDYHYNVRNFTGLSVWGEGGLIACGSETNQAFVYDCNKSTPVLTHSFSNSTMAHQNQMSDPWASNRLVSKGSLGSPEGDASSSLMVSAVCWRMKPNDCTLVAANSDGVLQVLNGRHSR